jgi:AcrR family transcriptional regulator
MTSLLRNAIPGLDDYEVLLVFSATRLLAGGRRVRRKAAKPARRRAVQERAQETIAVVLEGAAQVLAREGYARATTNRIAVAAGVSVGSIYQYFADKDAIFDALIRREIDGLQRILRAARPDPEASLADSLRLLLTTLVRARPEAPALYRSLEHVPNALFRRRVADARGSVTAWVRDFLALHRRELRVRDLDAAAFLIVSAAEGVAMNASPEFYRAQGADELTAMFTRYLTKGRTAEA